MLEPRLAAVLGHPVGHSLSPAMHNAAYQALSLPNLYVALDVVPAALPAALRGLVALGFVGANITVPHKQQALSLCDEVHPDAARVGCVNTVVVHENRLVGHNTDVGGFADSLTAVDATPSSGERAVVLGSGGAARAVIAALSAAGLRITVVARTPSRASDLVAIASVGIVPWTDEALARCISDAALLVDATSTALSPAAEAALPAEVPLDRLSPDAAVVSVVYHREPLLLRRARDRNLRTVDGAGMLLHQAARAFRLMTGHEAPVEVMRSALEASRT